MLKNASRSGRESELDFMEAEPELITIVEGPPPEFKSVDDAWMFSLMESSRAYFISLCQVRSLKGQVLMERCQRPPVPHSAPFDWIFPL